tara:strand:- start:310 stop:1233 length:924 start_codon:yes stop_codon:yes gene_type:complete
MNTPILFITYARSKYARKAFDAIKRVKPKNLYFYSNKAPIGNQDLNNNNNKIRGFVDEIDWDCNLRTFFRDKHIQIYTSLFSAIDWVFDNEKKAIIIEEDCVASAVFFDYCEKLLDYYEDESKVWMLSGNNFTPSGNPSDSSFFFSRFAHIYGWASWSDRWKKQDRLMESWDDEVKKREFLEYFQDKKSAIFFYKNFKNFYKKIERYNPWDYLNWYSMIINKAYCVVPNTNLVSNIGSSGFHNKNTKDFKSFNLPTPKGNKFIINKYLESIEPSRYDVYHFQHHYWLRRTTLLKKIKRKLNKIYKEI